MLGRLLEVVDPAAHRGGLDEREHDELRCAGIDEVPDRLVKGGPRRRHEISDGEIGPAGSESFGEPLGESRRYRLERVSDEHPEVVGFDRSLVLLAHLLDHGSPGGEVLRPGMSFQVLR